MKFLKVARKLGHIAGQVLVVAPKEFAAGFGEEVKPHLQPVVDSVKKAFQKPEEVEETKS